MSSFNLIYLPSSPNCWKPIPNENLGWGDVAVGPKSFCDVAATSPYGRHISITVVMAQEKGYGGKGIGTRAYRQGYKGKALKQDMTAMA